MDFRFTQNKLEGVILFFDPFRNFLIKIYSKSIKSTHSKKITYDLRQDRYTNTKHKAILGLQHVIAMFGDVNSAQILICELIKGLICRDGTISSKP